MPGGLACEPAQGLLLHENRGGQSSLVFAQALVSLISLVPGPVKTVCTEKTGVPEISIRNLNLDGHVFSTCSI